MRRNRLGCMMGLSLLFLAAGAGLGGTGDVTPGDAAPSEAAVASESRRSLSVEHLLTLTGFSPDHAFRSPMGLFLDGEHGEIYVADTGNNDIDVFTAEGEPRFRISSEPDLTGPLDLVGDARQLYVSQMERKGIVVFDFRGAVTQTFAVPGTVRSRPGRMAFGPKGELYVADRAAGSVLIFDKNGTLLRRIGEKGDADGTFELIAGVAVDAAGRVYTTDSKRHRIQVFEADGTFLRSVGDEQPGPLAFSFLGGIEVDSHGRIWVADSFRHQVKVFDENWELLLQFGGYGTDDGRFFFPVDLALDESGRRVYVLEKGSSRIQIFRIDDGRGVE